ncbi:MAG TPA: type II secretion system protein [Longimicrobiales bacterium]|nr:type II secretion system protein [Longimicrobiales bacterium]
MKTIMKNRPGFTLVEVMIALTLTAVLGAVFMGSFVSQSRFFDHQEKVGAARAVSRGALNIMMSEMRMVEQTAGVVSATNQQVELRVPYVFGMVCGSAAGLLTITTLPADLTAVAGLSFSGYAYRQPGGAYNYQEGIVAATTGLATICSSAGIVPDDAGVIPDPAGGYGAGSGSVIQIPLGPTIAAGTPVFLYHKVTYRFAASTSVPGGIALFRQVEGQLNPEELVAPFDTTAKFRFFESDAATAQDAVPASLSDITGIEVVLDAISERPNPDGSHQSVPLTTAVHFKNR